MRLKTLSAAAMALGLMAAASSTLGQAQTTPAEAGAVAMTSVQRDAVVAAVEAAFKKSYVFPDKVPAIVAALEQARKSGRYKEASAGELAGLISEDLRRASQDGHAYMVFDPQRYGAMSAAPADAADDELTAFDTARFRREHYGLSEMRILPGNVRYLKITGFEWLGDETGAAYDDAMAFLKGGDAVVIDLRGNPGGASEAVQYLVSHFMKAGTLEITFLHAGKDPVQTRVLDNLPSGRMIGKPLYVLIDHGAGSAAESFAYDVQQFKLGTLVGETTAGAANNNEFVPIAPGYLLSVSVGRPVHAVSGGNWEGTGVAPDVAAESGQALDVALGLALERLSAGATAELKGEYDWARAGVSARLHPVTMAEADLRGLSGNYGKYVVSFEDGGLWIARPGHPLWPKPRRLTPMTVDGLFAVDGIDMMRVSFGDGAMKVWWQDEAQPRVMVKG